MTNRLDLQELLAGMLGSGNVYFQPPASVKIKYPCFVYSLENAPVGYADDGNYKVNERYLLRYITKDPDDLLVGVLLRTDRFSFDRHYCADNLHHYVFTYTFH